MDNRGRPVAPGLGAGRCGGWSYRGAQQVTISTGDTVKVLSHRNAFDQDITTWGAHPFKVGESFVVGKVEDEDHGYPCDIIYPEGDDIHFWRADDLMITHSPAKLDRVSAYRKSHGVGLLEAKRMVEKEDLLVAIDAANSINDIKAILLQVVSR